MYTFCGSVCKFATGTFYYRQGVLSVYFVSIVLFSQQCSCVAIATTKILKHHVWFCIPILACLSKSEIDVVWRKILTQIFSHFCFKEFIHNQRKINNNEDFPRQFLTDIFNRIRLALEWQIVNVIVKAL